MLAERAFSRASGADAIDGNAVRLLLDARRELSGVARRDPRARSATILFESYIVADDDGRARVRRGARGERARAGVRVCVVYDWLGSLARRGAVGRAAATRAPRCALFNPPRFDSPLGWLSRDHRKSIVVDGHVGFVSGLCVSAQWEGNPAKRLEPWRDTGVEIRGPAVAELAARVREVWHACGGERAAAERLDATADDRAGGRRARARRSRARRTRPAPIASISRSRRSRASTCGSPTRISSAPPRTCRRCAPRRATASTCACSCPARATSRRCRRCRAPAIAPLLDAGVRVFEWNGTMLHAKTAVADGAVGARRIDQPQPRELDGQLRARRRDRGRGVRAARWQRSTRRTSTRATEIVLTRRNRVRRTERRRSRAEALRAPRASGSAGRAAAGAVSVGSALGAALTNRRTLGAGRSGAARRRWRCSRIGFGAVARALAARRRVAARGARRVGRHRVAREGGRRCSAHGARRRRSPTPAAPRGADGGEGSRADIIAASRP